MTQVSTVPCLVCGTRYPDEIRYWRRDTGTPRGYRYRCHPCVARKQREYVDAIRARAEIVRPARANPRPPPAPIPAAPIEDSEVTNPSGPPRMEPGTDPPAFAERYVITYAQNATPAHAGFLGALRVYCHAHGARLIVIPGRYRNPTSTWTAQQEHDEWWDQALVGDLFAGRLDIGRLRVLADISVQPTAERPLTGFEPLAQDVSLVVGHPKVQLRTLPSAERHYPRILATTGACTIANYTASKAGKKGEARHRIGALIVERDPHLFHLRHVEADATGAFTDLDCIYSADGIREAPRALALVLGDVHVAKADREVLEATLYARGSIADVLQPRAVVYHDTLDFDARNHHTRDAFVDRYDRVRGMRNDDVEAEVNEAIAFVDATPAFADPIVVRSNHDAAFDRWLREADGRADPRNAGFWFQTWAEVMRERERTGAWPDAFALCYARRGKARARFLALDEPFQLGGVWLHMHGDRGANGARGSLGGFARLGARVVVGHGHSPGILDDAYQGGACALDMTYNHGPSSWLTTHVVVYASGARTLISVIKGRWRADPVSSSDSR